jgi:hypothetical protein
MNDFNDDVKPALKHKESSEAKESRKKVVLWDTKQLEELEEEKVKNPKMKISEPKTPYVYCVR